MEDNGRQERMQRMLEMVRELKQTHYLGTKDAFNYLRASAAVYDNPLRVAREINEAAGLRDGNYQATPERLNGLATVLHGQNGEIPHDEFADINLIMCTGNPLEMESFETLGDFFVSSEVAMWPTLHDFNFGRVPFMDAYSGDAGIYNERVVNLFGDFFRDVNRSGVRTDREMGEFLELRLEADLERMNWEFDEFTASAAPLMNGEFATKEDFEGLPKKVRQYIARVDFGDVCSKGFFEESVRRARADAFLDHISYTAQLDRLMNDRLDHRLEYRRQLLGDYVQFIKGDFEFDYDSLIRVADDHVARSENSLKRFERGSAPEELIRKARRKLEMDRFTRLLLGGEGNWLKRYLDN